MSQLIKLSLTKRAGKATTGTYGFDIEDIVVPVRNNGVSSYFTSRMIKGTTSGSAHNNGRVDYEVSDALVGIAGQSSLLAILTVKYRRGVDMKSEKMVFVRSRISENLKPEAIPSLGLTGTKFYYSEDGDPLPVEYVVTESVTAIVSSGSTVVPLPTTVTEINYDLVDSDTIDLANLYSGELIINLTSTGTSSTLASIINYPNVTKITIRPTPALNPLTFTDGGFLKLYAPALSVFGGKDGFLELTKRNSKWYQTNYIDQYN